MPSIVCVKCGKFLRVKKIGVTIEEGMQGSSLGDDPATGWGPYKLWNGDLLGCPECGMEVVSGFGKRPLAEHFEDGYSRLRDKWPPIVRVNDCGGTKP